MSGQGGQGGQAGPERRPARRFRAIVIAIAISFAVAAALGGITAIGLRYRPAYHFDVVDPGIFYRSGQPGTRDLGIIQATAKIRTIIDLCPEKRDTVEAHEEREFALKNGIQHIHMPLREGMDVNAEKEIARFLEIVDDPKNRPVLMHCWKGVRRTAVMVSIYKMEYFRIDNEQAVRELPSFGRRMDGFTEAHIACVKNYVPRWKRAAGPGSGS